MAKGLDCDPLALLGTNVEEITEQEPLLLRIFRTLSEDERRASIVALGCLGGSKFQLLTEQALEMRAMTLARLQFYPKTPPGALAMEPWFASNFLMSD